MENNTLKLNFFQKIILFDDSSVAVELLRSENMNRMYLLEDKNLYIPESSQNGDWSTRSYSKEEYSQYKLRHTFLVKHGHTDLLIMTFDRGIILFKCYNKNLNFHSKLELSTSDNLNWNSDETDISFGRFYPDITRMGMITRTKNTIATYEIFNDFSIMKNLNDNSEILNTNCNLQTKLMIAHLKKTLRQMIICKVDLQLRVFDFDASYRMKLMMKIPYARNEEAINEKDKFFYANISGHPDWMDIVVLNSKGMFVYRFEENSKDFYELINYNPMFSVARGWTEKHTESVKFEDINDDGIDDLIFTGPGGIGILSYDFYVNKWKSLLNVEQLGSDERYTRILHVIPRTEGEIPATIIFSRHSNALHISKLIETPAEMLKIPSINANLSFPTPKCRQTSTHIYYNVKAQPRSTLYLKDQNIWFAQRETVNPRTGKPLFTLPLVGTSDEMVKFHLIYDASNHANTPMGIGWSMYQNFIALNYRDGNFEEDESYVWVLDNMPQKLKLLYGKSPSGKLLFELENPGKEISAEAKKVRVSYIVSSSTWEIDYGNSFKLFYGKYEGGQFGAVATDLGWENWRGRGFDTSNILERANMWYLAVAELKGVRTYFEYKENRKTSNLGSFNAEALLTRIRNGFKEIQLFYERPQIKKNENEDFYLANYMYRTNTSEQTVLFKRSLVGSSLLLTDIEQLVDNSTQSVVQFAYTKDAKRKYVLSKTILPTGVKVAYNYDYVGSPTPITEFSGRRIPVSDDYNVSYGPGFTLVSYFDKNSKKVILRMFNNDLTKEIYPSKESMHPWPQLHYSNAEAYEILTGDVFIAVIVYSNRRKQTCLFGKQSDDNWKVPPQCYVYNEESTILNDNNYILVSDPTSSAFLIEWLQDKNKWQIQLTMDSFDRLRSIAAYGNKFIVYDDKIISFGYKSNSDPQVWNLKTLAEFPGYLSETQNVLLKFNLKPDFFKSLWGFFRNNAVQFRHNLIVLSALAIHKNEVFVTKIKTFVVGRDYKVVSQNATIVLQDHFSDLISAEEFNSHRDKFSLKYVYRDDKFRIEVASFESPNGRFAGDINNKMNFPHAQRFLLDLKNYHVSLRGQVVECRNVKYFFAGHSWRESSIRRNEHFEDSTSVLLGDQFTLNKTDHDSTIKLYNASNERMLFDFGVKNITNMRVNYPVYIASHDGETLNVLEFVYETAFTITTLPKTMQLSPFGNAMSLVTSELDSSGTKHLLIWPMYDLRRFLPNSVVTSVKVVISGATGGSQDRTTGYAYKESSAQLGNNGVNYGVVTVLPGNSQNKFGYFTIGEHSVEYFNDKSISVKRLDRSNSEEGESEVHVDDVEDNSKETTLYDQSGVMEISRFPQILLSYQMAGYIGFETYETENSNWIFDREYIIRGDFALTGENYLRLPTKPMKGIFRPKFQDRPFLATCWIRTPCEKIPNIQDIVPFLTIVVLTAEGNHLMNFLAEVKLQIDNWSYLEVGVDMEFMHLISEDSNHEDLKLEIRISPSVDVPIDLDNIRFSSLRNMFDVNVYDNELSKRVAIIKSNGAITRFIYDKYQKKIADINESNQIEEFITYTKISHHSTQFGNPASVIKITPEKGYFQYFPFVISSSNHLYVDTRDIGSDSYGFRCLYSLPNESEFTISDFVKLQRTGSKVSIILRSDETTEQYIPAEGELLLLKKQSRVMVWIEGSLYIDQHSHFGGSLKVIVAGEVQFWEIMVFSRPQVRVIYKNALNEVIQEISLSSVDRASVREQLYDELGRQRITTKTAEIVRERGQSVISYVADFVTNDDPKKTDSVWKTGRLKGVINDLVGHEFGYSEVVYDNNPLNTIIRIGMAGEKFSASGEFVRHLNSTTSNPFLTARYHPDQFTYQVLSTPSGGEKIYIFNDNNLPVAIYIHVEKGKDRFSTFEYNDMGLMTKCWPSLYYEKTRKFDEISLDLIETSLENQDEAQIIATTIDYDSKGNPTSKASPDAGLVENIYDNDERLRFIIQYSQDAFNRPKFIVYFEYDTFGRLTSTGSLEPHFVSSQLLRTNITEANAIEYQRFYYSDSEEDPMFRRNILRAVTMHNGKPLHEEFIFDTSRNVISKRILIPNGSDQPEMIVINKRFEGDVLKEVIYPASMFGEPFRVVYEYDLLGRMVSVGIPGQTNRFLSITYNANNQVRTKTFTPLRKNRFTRSYKYNEPGFLIEIDDPFLREEISYTEKGYDSSRGYGDGTIMRVKFTARWHKLANINGIGVKEDYFNFMPLVDAKKCFQELKREGYLDSNNQQSRVLYPDLDVMLSFACTNGTMERKVKEVLGKYGFPKEYGFRFDYTDHMELRKAKYFVGRDEPTALRSNTFYEKIPGIDMAKSRFIWETLKSKGYIIEDVKGHGIQGKTFLRSTLLEDLKSVNPEFSKYEPLLRKLLVMQYSNQNSTISLSNVFAQWFPNASSDGASINQFLSRKKYFQNPLEMEFVNSMKNFSKFLPNIVAVLHKYFGVGRSEFDMESSAIDANGNILQISTGYKDFRLNYKENSNQISEVIYSNSDEENFEMSFKINHDTRGNVIHAFHKDLWIMEYHPVSNRLGRVIFTDVAAIVKFFYDSKGERVIKQVENVEGQLMSELQYFRDEYGRTLVERQSTFVAADQPPDVLVTIYIYGPKSLVGFVRRDQFYSVITDHEGSVRLIVRDGEVVAAYDYTPYGDLMRVYGNNPDAHILYRYTGQEWDPDLRLYNYHARFYDPTIGRFYQIDPMAQYFSPYKYAGNSPVSMVDSNGEVAFLLVFAIIGFTLLGAYLSGAAVNKSLNPYDWDWFNRETQLAVFVGAVTGALIPIGFSASVAALGGLSIASATLVTSVGLATAYMSVVANSKEWNPGNWDYVSIKTWKAAFDGFSMGVGIIGGWHSASLKFLALSRPGKVAFAGISVFYGGEMFITGSTDLDLNKPDFWFNVVTSAASAPDLSMVGRKIIKFTGMRNGKLLKSYNKAKNSISKIIEKVRKNNVPIHLAIRDVLQLKKLKLPRLTKKGAKDMLAVGSFLTFSIAGGYLMNGDFAQWDQTCMQTYHNFLNAHVMSGQYLEAISKTVKSSEITGIPTKKLYGPVSKTLRGAANQIRSIRRLGRFIRSAIEAKSLHYRATSQLSDSAKLTNFTLLIQFADSSLVFTRNRFTNPFIISKGNAATDNPTLVTNLIGRVPRILEKMIHDNFHQWNITSEITTDLDRNIIEKFKREIEGYFNSNNCSIIVRDSIDRIVRNINLENDQTRTLQQQYLSKERELTSIKEKLKFTNIQSSVKVKLLAEEKYLKIKIQDLKRKEKGLIGKSRSGLEEFFWNKEKTIYEDLIEIFEIENLVGQEKIELEKSIYLPNPNAFDCEQDINFLSSFKSKEFPVLTTFQKCYNCITTALKARIHVKDIRWLAFLNANYIESSQHEVISRKIQRQKRFIDIEELRNSSITKNSSEIKGNGSYLEKKGKTFYSTWDAKLITRNQSPQPTALNFKSDENEKEKLFPSMTATPWSIMDFGDKLVDQLTTNKTLLLAEVILAKYKKCKLFRVPEDNSNSVYTLELALACEVILLSEKTIEAAANASDIPMNSLDMSGEFELQKKILKILTQRKFDQIPDLIIKFALSVLPEANNPKFGELSRRKINRYQTFLRSFNFNSKIDEIFRKSKIF